MKRQSLDVEMNEWYQEKKEEQTKRQNSEKEETKRQSLDVEKNEWNQEKKEEQTKRQNSDKEETGDLTKRQNLDTQQDKDVMVTLLKLLLSDD